jgi:hypothetical protein
LPIVGQHIQVTGDFMVDVPSTCSFQVPRINEHRRQHIGQHKNCTYVGCEFEEIKLAAWGKITIMNEYITALFARASAKTNSDNVQAIAACLASAQGAIKEGTEMAFMIHVTNYSINQRRRILASRN